MAEDWNAIAAEVGAAIAEVGFAATLERPGSPTGPTHNPTPGTPVQVPVTILSGDFSWRDVDGTTIHAQDRLVTISTTGLASPPTPADTLIVNGVRLKIITVRPLDPGGVALLYDVQVRR